MTLYEGDLCYYENRIYIYRRNDGSFYYYYNDECRPEDGNEGIPTLEVFDYYFNEYTFSVSKPILIELTQGHLQKENDYTAYNLSITGYLCANLIGVFTIEIRKELCDRYEVLLNKYCKII